MSEQEPPFPKPEAIRTLSRAVEVVAYIRQDKDDEAVQTALSTVENGLKLIRASLEEELEEGAAEEVDDA